MLKSPLHSVFKGAAAGIALVAGIAGTPSVSAQEALEEITVTARKVSESLEEAPLSVVVFTGETMANAGVSRIEELVTFVPNFAMSETGIGTNLYVRGIGSGINQGFEQSVGLYVDDIYYGRAQLTRAPFMDMAQAEALRGPQAILLGNNSIAGALVFTTAKPTDTFESTVSGMYVPDQNEQEINAMISGPLTDKWSARFAGRYRGTDGYENNTILNRDEPNRDEKSGRITLAYKGDGLDGTLKFEKNKFDVKGRQIEIIRADPVGLPANTTCFTANAGCPSLTGFSNNGSKQLWLDFIADQVANNQGVPNYLQYLNEFFDPNPAILDGTLDYNRGSNGDKSNNDIDIWAGTLNYDLGENTLTATAAHLDYNYVENCDCDFTGANMFLLESTEDFQQNSLELRWASPQKERFKYLAGVYYQHDQLNFGDQIFLPIDSGVVRLVGLAVNGTPTGAYASLGNTSAFRNFDQDTTTSSVFGQVSMDITERWRTSLGLRYSHIEKEAIRILREGDLERVPYNLNDANGLDRLSQGAVLFGSIFKVAFHNLGGSLTEDPTAFELVSDFNVTDDIMVYGSVKTGFKSGGYDARSNSDPNVPIPGAARPDNNFTPIPNETQGQACTSAIAFAAPNPLLTGSGTLFPAGLEQQVCQNVTTGSFEYKPEKAFALEAGAKISLLNNTADLNVTAFRTKFDNLQVSIFDGTLGFNVGNAASAITQGVEVDGRWSLTDDWSLGGSAGYLNFNFEDFPNGQCNQGQVPTSPNGYCDYTGKTNQYVAKWSGTLTLGYEHPLGDFLFKSALDSQFTTPYSPTQNMDSRASQAGYALWNLRVALASADEKWEVAVLGRNLTDRAVVSYANDTPLAYSQFGTPTFYGFIDPPRTIALQASYRFGD